MVRGLVGRFITSLVAVLFLGGSIGCGPADATSEATSQDVSELEQDTGVTRGLLIRKKWMDRILAGTKTWEIRSANTAIRGAIALLQSGSGEVVGTTELADVVGPLTLDELNRNSAKTGFTTDQLPYENTYAWVLRDSKRLPTPVPYEHPAGAVIWVKLDPSVVQAIEKQSP